MTHRDRVLKTLAHKEPDRIPVDFGGWLCGIKPLAYKNLCQHVGIVSNGWKSYTPQEAILRRWDIDFRRITVRGPSRTQKKPDGTTEDEWGVVRRYEAGDEQIVTFPLKHASVDDIPEARTADPALVWKYDEARNQGRKLQNEGFAVVAQPNCQGVFEQACWLCGFERILMDILTQPDFVHALFEKITRIQETYARDYYGTVGNFADIVQLGDDFGTQQGPFLGSGHYCEFIRPYQMRYHKAIREGTDAAIFHHSCGSVYKLLDAMIESGIDILNPVQVGAADMDPMRLKEEFGDRIVFHGTIDDQKFLPVKSPAEIRSEVKRLIRIFGPGGGYILAPSHNIQDDTPPENITAMFDAALEFGTYPIR